MKRGKKAETSCSRPESLRWLRLGLLVLALGLIVLGVLNGGMRDACVKAVNICAECIGLG